MRATAVTRRADRSSRRPRGERGVASIELLAIMPLGLLLALVGLQVGSFMWAVTNANEAVRQGARAQSLGDNGCDAAEATLSRSLELASPTRCVGGDGPFAPPNRVTVHVKVPIIPFIRDYVPDPTIERTATLP